MTAVQVLAFLVASLVLAITPGPGVAYVVARTLAQGRRAGLASVLGVALGNLGNGIGAALGLALLFEAVPPALEVVKLLGAAYLFFLGASALRAPEGAALVPSAAPSATLVRDGFVVALLNPKTAVFFAAFLPQFLGPDARGEWLTVALAATFVLIAATTDSIYVLAAAAVAPRLRGEPSRRAMRWLPAATYFGLAFVAALR